MAAENAAAIAATPGADIIFIGVNDLAGSIGRLEQTGHPDVQALVAKVEAAIRASGKIMGTVPHAGASVSELLSRGYRVIAGPHDVALLRDAAAGALAEYRNLASGEAPAGAAIVRSY